MNRSDRLDDSFGEWGIDLYTSDDQSSADTPADAWSAVGEAWREQPGPYRSVPYVPGPQAGSAVALCGDSKGLTIVVVVLAPVTVVLLVGAIVYFYFSDSKGANSADSNSSQSVQSASIEDSSTSSTAEQKRRAEGFRPSSNWHHCSGSGDPGDLNLAYAEDIGDNTTTCQFATNVRNSFVEQHQLMKKFDNTITASSSTTGRTCTTTCRGSDRAVTRTGGTNATAHIV